MTIFCYLNFDFLCLTMLLCPLMSSTAGPALVSWANKHPISTALITLQSMVTNKILRKNKQKNSLTSSLDYKKFVSSFNNEAWPWLLIEWGIAWEEVVFIWSEHAVLQVCQLWTSWVWELGLPPYNSYVISPRPISSQKFLAYSHWSIGIV